MRKAKPKKRVVLPDPIFGDVMVSKFVNHLMYDGKKTIAYTIFYSALEVVKGKMANEDKSALEIWKTSLHKLRLNLVVSVVLLSKFLQKYVQNVKNQFQ